MKKTLIFRCVFALQSCAALAACHTVTDPTTCVNTFAERAGISLDQHTDVTLLRTLALEDMRLAGHAETEALLEPHLARPTALRSLLESIREGVSHHRPDIGSFLCTAMDSGLIADASEEARADLKKAIHRAFLLELLTARMVESATYMDSLREHLMRQREALGVDSTAEVYEVTGGLFEVVKLHSIDGAMDRISTVRRTGEVSVLEQSGWRDGLDINIVEATTREVRNGFSDNAYAGTALLGRPYREMRVVGDHNEIEIDVTQDWTNLYQSWNLAFITANVGHADILFPKLLIPQVLLAQPRQYVFRRILALWLSINFYVFAQVQGSSDIHVRDREALARAWGSWNRDLCSLLPAPTAASR